MFLAGGIICERIAHWKRLPGRRAGGNRHRYLSLGCGGSPDTFLPGAVAGGRFLLEQLR